MSFDYSTILTDASVIIGILATALVMMRQLKRWFQKISTAAVVAVKADNNLTYEKLSFAIEMSHKCITRLEEKIETLSQFNLRDVDDVRIQLGQIRGEIQKAHETLNNRSPMFEQWIVQLDEMTERLLNISDFQKNHELNDAHEFAVIKERLDALGTFKLKKLTE